MSMADKLFKQLFNEFSNNLHTSMPCTVEQYYPGESAADIKPLFKRKINGETMDYPTITKAPVLKHVCAAEELKPGDKVLVTFAERALDYAGNRRHDLTDAVVIGVMP